jgi:hypothetical protein
MPSAFSSVPARATALGAALAVALAPAAGATEPAPWSQPAPLSSCAANSAPAVVFPHDRPNHATGPGAIVWSATTGCPGGEGARVARVGAGDLPTQAVVPGTAGGHPLAPRGPLSVSAGPRGRIVIAGRSPGAPDDALVIQGSAGEPFGVLWSIHGDPLPLALATGYLGDVALASPPAGSSDSAGLHVHVERYFADALAARPNASTWGTRSTSALAVALDYRTDALTVWAQAGSLWAHDLPASGAFQPVSRLAAVGPHVRIAALLSDDGQATVAWSEEHAGVTSVYLERSRPGVQFDRPVLLERFRDPDGLRDPAGSPRLVRLSSESVMMAWAGSAAERWVLHTAAIDFHGLGAIGTIAAPAGDALLDDLAPGPAGNALALWSEPQPGAGGAPDMGRQALFSARGFDVHPDATRFGAPEEVAPPGAHSNATLALDPASNRAVAVWQAERGTLQYAVRNPSNGAR